ncbi:MAG TPA: O-antigen ligase family protein [Vicinamibacterales bacterium]|nr:O-antigen ligase family protein [Vicinamibacterales bacterium]
MTTRSSPLIWIGFLLITASLGVVQFSLLAAQGFLFSAAAIVWTVVAAQEGRRPDVPAFFLPLLVYAGLTLVSAALSHHPHESLWDSRQLLMFLMVPIVARFAQGDRAIRTMDVIIAIGAAGALVGIFQFAILGKGDLNNRLMGPLGHWMTYSGVLMLTTCAAVARLTFTRMRSPWPAIAVPALLVALVVTNTRNAWIGTFLAVTVLLAIRNWRLVVVVPVVATLALLVAPGMVKARAASIFDTSDPANRDRMVMWKIGADMIRDHPWFGVGPHRVQDVYVDYRQKYPEAVNETNPHLHNVPIQIAAERGLPALAAWLWFVMVAARDLWRQVRSRVAPAVAGAGLAALIAMLAAGLFEYNFGDSEFLMLFLGLVTLPYAARK